MTPEPLKSHFSDFQKLTFLTPLRQLRLQIFFTLSASGVSPQRLGDVFDIVLVRERPQTQNERWKNSNIQKNMPKVIHLSVRPETCN